MEARGVFQRALCRGEPRGALLFCALEEVRELTLAREEVAAQTAVHVSRRRVDEFR